MQDEIEFNRAEPDEPRLDEVVESLALVLWEADPDTLAFTFVGPYAEELTGFPPERWKGEPDFWFSLIHPLDRDKVVAQRWAAVRAGRDSEIEYRIVASDGRVVWVLDKASLIKDDHEQQTLRGLLIDTSERRAKLRRDEAHHAVMSILADAPTIQDIMPKILKALCEGLEWDLGLFWIVDPKRKVLRCTGVWPPATTPNDFADDSFRTEFAQGVGLTGDVWASGEPLWIVDVALDRNFPRAPAALREGYHSAFAFPIKAGGTVIATVEFFSQATRQPDHTLLRTVRSMGIQLGHLMERDMAQEALRQSEERSAFLAQVGEALAARFDPISGLRQLSRMLVPFLAEWCIVDLVKPDLSIERVAVNHSDPKQAALARKVKKRFRGASDPPPSLAKVLSREHPIFIADLSDPGNVEMVGNHVGVDMITRLGARSFLCVPLIARGRTLGAITLLRSAQERAFTGADLSFAEDLARVAALTVDNSLLYAESSSVARTLQQTLLPPQLPEIPSMEVAACYHPSGRGNEVGGDFYDVFPARGKDWGVLIGDVCGKGVEAAVVTALARYTGRAAAMQEPKPSRALAMVNKAIIRSRDDDRFCSMICARIRPTETGARLIVSSGGHELPLILRGDGRVENVGKHGQLLGIFPDPVVSDVVAELHVGDTVVFYTDGVTEARGPDGFFGEDTLRSLLESCVGSDASSIVRTIEQAVFEFQQGDPHDDVAVLALRVGP